MIVVLYGDLYESVVGDVFRFNRANPLIGQQTLNLPHKRIRSWTVGRNAGDGGAIFDAERISILSGPDAEILLFDMA